MSEPSFVPPMLATLVRTLPEGSQWEYELKLDGYRLQAVKHEGQLRLYSRRGSDFTDKFAKIAASVSKIKASSFVLDGEAVAVDEQGKPSFQVLQNRSSLPKGWALAYYAFDLLHLEGKDLKARPLHERRALLGTVLGNSGVLLSQSLPGTLSQIMQAVREHSLEGVIAKRLESPYQPDRRSDFWLKLPLKPNQDFVVGGFRLDGKPLELATLKTRNCYLRGKSTRDLTLRTVGNYSKSLSPLTVGKCPFANLPTSRTGHWGEGVTAEEMSDYVWLNPEIVAEIRFAEWTSGGVLRHAEFVALRDDKDPKEVGGESLI